MGVYGEGREEALLLLKPDVLKMQARRSLRKPIGCFRLPRFLVAALCVRPAGFYALLRSWRVLLLCCLLDYFKLQDTII